MIDRLVGVVLSLLAPLAGPSYAQDYPNRPIRVVVAKVDGLSSPSIDKMILINVHKFSCLYKS